MRTCVGCGKSFAKAKLYRIVKSPTGSISFDAMGRAGGRGAYVCSPECLTNAIGRNKVQRALRANVGVDVLESVALDVREAMSQEDKR